MTDTRSFILRLSRPLTSFLFKVHPCFRQKHRLSHFKTEALPQVRNRSISIPEPQLNIKRLCDPNLTQYFSENINLRKGIGNIQRVIELNEEYQKNKSNDLRCKLIQEALNIPNDTHPLPSQYGEQPKVIKVIGKVPEYQFPLRDFESLMDVMRSFRTDALSHFAGQGAYYFIGELAELEHALIRFTLNHLKKKGFLHVSVPDILRHQIIEGCGFSTKGHNQVYCLDPRNNLSNTADGDLCLSGTAEMALGGYLMNRLISEKDLPLRLTAVSRCYRPESGGTVIESGLYRVHQFTKVEMFGVTTENGSEELFEEFRNIQEEICDLLELHVQVLDMPSHDLGASAYRKYDLEAWLPGRKRFGEVSSCSNCTDFQSRRLNIQYESQDNIDIKHFAHTVNGTACAIPRLIIALCETNQRRNCSVRIPPVLRPYMRGKEDFFKSQDKTLYGRYVHAKFRQWDKLYKHANEY